MKGQIMMFSNNVAFWPTPDFKYAFGPMDPITYDYLKEQVINGKGELIPMANGLCFIKISVQVLGATNPSWFVIYAVYQAQELVIFLKKYPVDADGFILFSTKELKSHQPFPFRKKLTTENRMSLAKAKEDLDKVVKKRFRKNNSSFN